jgi:CMP-N,N'-diacetyllegionaminic acid synthase
VSDLNVVAVIPARAGSKGIPDKNLQEISSKSLLNWATQACLKTPSISRTIVSTDSTKYVDLASQYGAEAPFLRPAGISTDKAGDIGFVLHLIDFLKSNSKLPDLIVHIRPTTPIRNPEVLNAAVECAAEHMGKVTALRSIHKMSESAYKSFEVTDEGELCTVFRKKKNIEKSNNARQSFPETFVANGYIDILFPEQILKTGLLHGKKVRAFETEPVLEVDSFFELDLIRAQVEKNPIHKKRIFGDNGE